MTWDEIEKRLQEAKRMFLERDADLLDAGVNERSLTHKFACYMQPLFEPWNVDCEYNRDGYDPKAMPKWTWHEKVSLEDTKASTVFPDIIIHRRKTKANLVVIEAKKSGADQKLDKSKLRAYMRSDTLAYQFGVLMTFHVDGAAEITIQPVLLKDLGDEDHG